MNLQTGCIKAYVGAVGKQITSKLGELDMEEAAQQWRFKDDVDAMVEKMQDLEEMLHDADDRLSRGGMVREVVGRSPVSASPLRQCPPLHGRSICSALHRPLDLHRPTLVAPSAPPQKSTGTSSRVYACSNSRGTKRKGRCCSCRAGQWLYMLSCHSYKGQGRIAQHGFINPYGW